MDRVPVHPEGERRAGAFQPAHRAGDGEGSRGLVVLDLQLPRDERAIRQARADGVNRLADGQDRQGLHVAAPLDLGRRCGRDDRGADRQRRRGGAPADRVQPPFDGRRLLLWRLGGCRAVDVNALGEHVSVVLEPLDLHAHADGQCGECQHVVLVAVEHRRRVAPHFAAVDRGGEVRTRDAERRDEAVDVDGNPGIGVLDGDAARRDHAVTQGALHVDALADRQVREGAGRVALPDGRLRRRRDGTPVDDERAPGVGGQRLDAALDFHGRCRLARRASVHRRGCHDEIPRRTRRARGLRAGPAAPDGSDSHDNRDPDPPVHEPLP